MTAGASILPDQVTVHLASVQLASTEYSNETSEHPAVNNHNDSKPSSHIYICGYDLSQLPRNTMFAVCIIGTFTAYLLYGTLQEAIFGPTEMRLHSPYLTLYQFAIYSMIAYGELRMQGSPIRRGGVHSYCLLALLTLGTIAFSNASVSYLNYPTQVIFKCCKMIPVMIGGVIVQRKGYSMLEVLAVLCMTLGLVCFTMIDISVQPTFTFVGVVLISLALCCDGALGNYQELVMRKLKCSNTEILFFSYTIGFFILLTGLLISNQLIPSIHYFHQNPIRTYGYGLVFSLCGYFGIHFVLCIVQSHGALTAVTVTTFRKAVSMILSFVLFEKRFSFGYVWSGLLVILGLYLNVYTKNRKSWDPIIYRWLYKVGIVKNLPPSALPV